MEKGHQNGRISYSEKEGSPPHPPMEGDLHMANTHNNLSQRNADTPQTLPSYPHLDDSAANTPQTLPSYPHLDGNLADIPQTLPSFPHLDNDAANTPQTLPSYPSVDGSGFPVSPLPIPPQTQQPSYPSSRCCRVRFFHAAPQSGPVNISIGGQRVASNLAFGNFSSYYCFAEGFRTVTILNASNGRTVLLRKTVPLGAGELLTFVIVNNASTGALELSRISDIACSGQMGGYGCLRMANFLMGDTAVDLLSNDGSVLFSDVRYKEVTMARRLGAGRYGFYVVNTPPLVQPRVSRNYLPGYGEFEEVLSFALRVRQGVMYTAYLIGQANTDEIQVVVAEN